MHTSMLTYNEFHLGFPAVHDLRQCVSLPTVQQSQSNKSVENSVLMWLIQGAIKLIGYKQLIE